MSSLPSITQPAADALEQRDPWRNAWQAITSDVLLASLCVIVLLALSAGYILPQIPASGTADPLSYSQWQTQARASAGSFYDVAATLGIFSVSQAFWLRIVLAVLVVIVVLRVAERLSRLLRARDARDRLYDEERMRVTDHSPALQDLAAWLRAKRYRVIASAPSNGAQAPDESGWLVVDRSPWAEVASIVFHIGLLVAVTGILLNGLLGWDVARQQIDTDSAVSLQGVNLGLQLQSIDKDEHNAVVQLQGNREPVDLALGQQVQLRWLRTLPVPCCLGLRLTEVTPGFRVSATNAAGQPLTITASSYADPAREVLLTFRRDEPGRLVAVEEAGMAVLVSQDNGGSVQVYGVPSGNVLTDTLVRPSMVISGTTLQFRPTTSAVVAIQYRPGDAALWIGSGLALIGLIAVSLWPMQRLVVRHHGHWTEFYASGRGIRHVVRELLSAGNSQQATRHT